MSTSTTGGTAIQIQGMTCGHCVRAVQAALAEVPGLVVRSVNVGEAVVEGGPGVVEKAVAAIRAAGYEAGVGKPKGGCGCCGGSCDSR